MCRSEEGLPRDQGRQGLLEIFQLRGRLAGLKSESGRGAQMLCHKNNKWTGAGRGRGALAASHASQASPSGCCRLRAGTQNPASRSSSPAVPSLTPAAHWLFLLWNVPAPRIFLGNKGSGYPLCPLSSSSCEMVYLGVARVLWLELLWTVPSQCTFLHTCLHVYH